MYSSIHDEFFFHGSSADNWFRDRFNESSLPARRHDVTDVSSYYAVSEPLDNVLSIINDNNRLYNAQKMLNVLENREWSAEKASC